MTKKTKKENEMTQIERMIALFNGYHLDDKELREAAYNVFSLLTELHWRYGPGVFTDSVSAMAFDLPKIPHKKSDKTKGE